MLNLPTVAQVEEMLSDPEMANCEKGSQEMKIGKVLIFSAWFGENIDQLSIGSGVPFEEVSFYAGVLESSGVFGKGINHYKDYISGKGSGIILCLDIACGMRQLKRGAVKPSGEATWVCTEYGMESIEENVLRNPEAVDLMNKLDKSHGFKPGTTVNAIRKKNRK